jgi:hypothetical protein
MCANFEITEVAHPNKQNFTIRLAQFLKRVVQATNGPISQGRSDGRIVAWKVRGLYSHNLRIINNNKRIGGE